jgi:excisionase family DNA binding protein
MNGRVSDSLLTVEEAAARLNTGARFVRRLIAERRITFVHVGRHVRVPEAAVAAFIEANTVQPLRPRNALRRAA